MKKSERLIHKAGAGDIFVVGVRFLGASRHQLILLATAPRDDNPLPSDLSQDQSLEDCDERFTSSESLEQLREAMAKRSKTSSCLPHMLVFCFWPGGLSPFQQASAPPQPFKLKRPQKGLRFSDSGIMWSL